MSKAVLLSAVRTPIGKYLKAFASVKATTLGAVAVRAAIERADLEPGAIDEVIMGNVLQANVGQNPARQAALGAGLPDSVAAFTVNKVCGSGLKAVELAAQAVRLGDARFIVAGGMESMSQAPHMVAQARSGVGYGHQPLTDHLLADGLTDAFTGRLMGDTGNIVAERHSVTREAADLLSSRSHARALAAREAFKAEIVPVEVPGRKGAIMVVDTDEGPRASTPEALGTLRPAFAGPVVTAGNASQLSDGASAVVVASSEVASGLGKTPLATLVGFATAGVKPEWVMEAPIPATRRLLEQVGWKPEEVDLWEHNEAFASASCAVQAAFAIPDDRFNVNGGAVALGHPLGATGARILTTLAHALVARDQHRGVATLCLGGGNAISVAIER